MTLTTHILVAGAAAKIVGTAVGSSNPALIFAVALLSHYLLDMIPHWSYRLPFVENGGKPTERKFRPDKKRFAIDFSKTALDGLLGTAILFALASPTSFLGIINTFLAAAGGMAPDGLQGIQVAYKKFPMPLVQRLHDFFHFKNKNAESDFRDLAPTFLSIGSQLALVVIAVLAVM